MSYLEYFEIKDRCTYLKLKNLEKKYMKNTLKIKIPTGSKDIIGIDKNLVNKIINKFSKEKKHNYQYGRELCDFSSLARYFELPVLIIKIILETKNII